MIEFPFFLTNPQNVHFIFLQLNAILYTESKYITANMLSVNRHLFWQRARNVRNISYLTHSQSDA